MIRASLISLLCLLLVPTHASARPAGPPVVIKKSQVRDLAAIRSSLDRQRGPLRKACKPKKGAHVELKVVVDGTGKVLGVKAKGKLGKCVAAELTGGQLSRTGDSTVQVTYPLMW